jgi:hypothetical protein
MPIAKSLGFKATQATNQIVKNAVALSWCVSAWADLPIAKRREIYIDVFKLVTELGFNNCGSAYELGRNVGIPEEWAAALIADIKAGVMDAKAKGDI